MRKIMAKAKKIKITVNVDEHLLLEVKNMAEETGTPYQSPLNRALRDGIISKTKESSRLNRLERKSNDSKKNFGLKLWETAKATGKLRI